MRSETLEYLFGNEIPPSESEARIYCDLVGDKFNKYEFYMMATSDTWFNRIRIYRKSCEERGIKSVI